MEYKLVNETGDTFYTEENQHKIYRGSYSFNNDVEGVTHLMDKDGQAFEVGGFKVTFYNNSKYDLHYSEGSREDFVAPYHYYDSHEFDGKEIEIKNNGETILDLETKSPDVKLENIIDGIVAYCYARKNSVSQVTGGKTKREIKKLSLEELEEVGKKTNELEEVFKQGLQDVLDGKEVDFQELLDKNFGKGACDLRQETQKLIDEKFAKINQEKLAAEEAKKARAAKEQAMEARREKIDKFFNGLKEGLVKLVTPVKLTVKAIGKLKDSIVKGACHMADQAKAAKENRKLKNQALLNIQENGREIM